METKKTKFITKDIFKTSIIEAFKKLNPKYMMKNPVMFVVEIGFIVTLILTIVPSLFGDEGNNLRAYNGIVTIILFITVLFANFAEAVAEGRGKAQADTLKKTRKDTVARVIDTLGNEKMISASELKLGDIVLVNAGEVIPNDGEVIEGIASVDESAITGESAPVMRESGGDFASVTGGTTVVSDWLKIRITTKPGESFLDKMIALVEGASRQKTPNEIALNTLLVGLTLIFMVVLISLYPMANYAGVKIPISTMIALLVCLIPTTIGGLLSAIGIAGMDRVTRFNVIASEAILEGTIRLFNPELRKQIPGILERIAKSTAEAYRADAELEYGYLTPAVINDKECSKIATDAAIKLFGEDCITLFEKVTGAEDLAEFMNIAPGALAFVGARNESKGACYPHHHGCFNIDEDVLEIGTALYVQYAVDFLNK